MDLVDAHILLILDRLGFEGADVDNILALSIPNIRTIVDEVQLGYLCDSEDVKEWDAYYDQYD